MSEEKDEGNSGNRIQELTDELAARYEEAIDKFKTFAEYVKTLEKFSDDFSAKVGDEFSEFVDDRIRGYEKIVTLENQLTTETKIIKSIL